MINDKLKMMESNLFRKSNQFKLLKQADGFFLENNRTGGIIETDETGYKLLELLPGSPESVKDRLASRGDAIADTLIQGYFLLFREAGVIESKENTGAADPMTIHTAGASGPNKNPGISVVIVTRNSERFILKNLASIYRQTLVPGEVIVVDNDSADSTVLSVEKEYPQVKVLRSNKNLHYARSVNKGIKLAKGELFVVLNDDIELAPDFMERIVDAYENAEARETLAAIAPLIKFNKLRSFINSAGNMVLKYDWGADNFMGVIDLGQFREISMLGSVCFGAVTIPRRAWQIVGEMDGGFKFYDDIDWCFRAHRQGLKIRFVPGAIAYHEFGGTYPSGMKLTFTVKSRLRLVFKHFSWKILWEFLGSYIKVDIKNNFFLPGERSMKKFLAYAKGYLLFFLEVPGILWYRLKRKRVTPAQVKEFFDKNSPLLTLVNHHNQPLITKEVIEGYYAPLLPHLPHL